MNWIIIRIFLFLGFAVSLYTAINKNSSFYNRKSFYDKDMSYKEGLVDFNRFKSFAVAIIFLMMFLFSFIK
ncbi:hypothetical protein SAMN05444401_0386 [Clostridium amylolyticum]|uniref:Protein-export membrane protein SecG n=1 Tax=Clostridium amylolyticum TaxID=1121298 RepID=A0A1M6P0C1_9CLOT|nr:hypothetical protein [Clostridium amylolyticum]SHK01437.1 hypothetical protein SAMN05444401_0386 [Clostridium amylolyticum]